MSQAAVQFESMKRTTAPKEIGLSALRADLGRLVERAEAGEEIVITHRGRQVARLGPMNDPFDDMLAAGEIDPPTRPRSPKEKLPKPIKLTPGPPISDYVRR